MRLANVPAARTAVARPVDWAAARLGPGGRRVGAWTGR
jgi:hypothetical protein